MEIKVRYHSDITPISKNDNGDWIDLRAAEDVIMEGGDFKLISLGVSIQLPEGYEAYIIPRSSTFETWGIIQSDHFGLIDNSYCGDNDVWMFPALAIRNTIIHKNDRICQFRVQKKMEDIVITTVDKLENANRGGFGTSGKV
jgi:dUTP pyrophosphatase